MAMLWTGEDMTRASAKNKSQFTPANEDSLKAGSIVETTTASMGESIMEALQSLPPEAAEFLAKAACDQMSAAEMNADPKGERAIREVMRGRAIRRRSLFEQ